MKKLFIALIASFLISFGFISCDNSEECNCDSSSGCGIIEVSKKESITMCIIPNDVTINSLNKLTICNETREDLSYGTPFSIEYFNGTSWETSNFVIDIMWEGIEYIVKAGKAVEHEMNLYLIIEKWIEGEKGKYRVLKKINQHELYAEFEVK